MKFCPDCGYQLTTGNERFCPRCGESLNIGGATTEANRRNPSISIEHTGGDVIGVDVPGSGNIIGKEITINETTYNELEPEFKKSLIEFLAIINKDIETFTGDQKKSLDESINSLAKEVEGLKAGQVVQDQEKRDEIKSKQITLAEKVVNYSPKVAESIALATPLAPFSKVIGEGTEYFAEWIRRKLAKKKP